MSESFALQLAALEADLALAVKAVKADPSNEEVRNAVLAFAESFVLVAEAKAALESEELQV